MQQAYFSTHIKPAERSQWESVERSHKGGVERGRGEWTALFFSLLADRFNMECRSRSELYLSFFSRFSAVYRPHTPCFRLSVGSTSFTDYHCDRSCLASKYLFRHSHVRLGRGLDLYAGASDGLR